MSLIKEYFELTKKYQIDYGVQTILLMQVGSFFEVYGYKNKKTQIISGSNIEAFSRICDLNIVEKNVCVPSNSGEKEKEKEKDLEVLMAGFKDIQIEKYIKKIQEAGYTAVIYVQDEAAKNTTRSCAGIFSPGTYFSNDSQKLSNNISCIWIDVLENKMLLKGKHVLVGLANMDILTGKSNLYQFKEAYTNNPTDFDALEHFISVYKPSELICISNLPEKEINTILHYSHIPCNSIHILSLSLESQSDSNERIHNGNNSNQFIKKAKNCEKQVYQKEILNTFFKKKEDEIWTLPFYENTIASQAFCFLLDFVYQHNPYLVYKLEEPVFENSNNRLLLANHSLKQLNILDDRENSYTGNYSSVLKMLNICITAMGKRKFQQLFLNPSYDTNWLQKEYDITEYLLLNNLPNFLNDWKSKLLDMKDISKWERQIFLKKMIPRSFYQLYQNLKSIQDLWASIYSKKELLFYLNNHIKNISFTNTYCKEILQFLETNFELSILKDLDGFQGFETNFICKGINPGLDEKNAKMNECENKLEAIRCYLTNCIENKEKKSKNSSNNDYVKIHETEKNNYNLITTNRRCKLLQDALPEKETIVLLTYKVENKVGENKVEVEEKVFEFKISKKQFDFPKQSATNCFIQDSQIQQLCKSISQIKISMKDVITTVYQSILFTFGETYHEKLDVLISFITWIDVILARAIIADKYHYCKPMLEPTATKSFIKAKNLRHCLIEFLQTDENYVSNDIELGTNKKNGILLYGTNAVGKTSFIKSIGISIVMAQSGLYVPCSEFIYKPYHAIFTRILGNDNLFKGLSTFAVEMSELRTILRLANENSLVLGDELCSGTENSSAISIFVAGILRLEKANSSFIFATHLHEIVYFEEIKNLESVHLKHMAVIYDKEKDMLVYDRKLKEGPGNNMYGLEVCKSLHLPSDFIDVAYQIRMKYRNNESEVSSVLTLPSSHFNAKKIMGICEKCGLKIGTEVHHLQHQKDANEKGILERDNNLFHKNNLANLITLCESCHHEIHKTKKQHKKVKTTKGIKVVEIL